jgi:hypothetical protein
MTTSTMAHTWAFEICGYKLNVFCLPQHNKIAALNSKVSSNTITLLTNLVLIGVFSFRGHNPLSMHALSHSCLLFLDFFVHAIVLCNAA